jgi:hypothetical protein
MLRGLIDLVSVSDDVFRAKLLYGSVGPFGILTPRLLLAGEGNVREDRVDQRSRREENKKQTVFRLRRGSAAAATYLENGGSSTQLYHTPSPEFHIYPYLPEILIHA